MRDSPHTPLTSQRAPETPWPHAAGAASGQGTPPARRSLAELESGALGVIAAVEGEQGFRQRLLELGLTPGTPVRAIRRAPLGDPLEAQLRGYNLSLRRAEARSIRVEPAEGAADANGPSGWAQAPAPCARALGPTTSDRDLLATVVAPTSLGAEPHRSPRPWRVLLAGNPNTGKTTLFNALTGGSARVGNYPGITVERLVGRCSLGAAGSVQLIDLPGTYSLNARSHEEQLALDDMLGRSDGQGRPDAVVVLLAARALERSLYLLLQVQELGIPVLGVVNMIDEAAIAGQAIDTVALATHLETPFVAICARSGAGLDQLRDALARLLLQRERQARAATAHWCWQPSAPVDHALETITATLAASAQPPHASSQRAYALWLLMSLREHDDLQGIGETTREATRRAQAALTAQGHDVALEAASARYACLDAHRDCFITRGPPRRRPLTPRVDAVLTHPVAGMAVFLLLLALVFTAIFDWAAPLMDGIDRLVGATANLLESWLPGSIAADLLANGVVRGVGSVIVFLPQIVILFFFLTLLEGSGYMSRAAFMMDRLMRALGLPGKAVVPLVSGFACAIPAIMATRTLESQRDRLLTMMVIPLISCSARLPIYTLLIGTLFPAEARVFGPISVGMLMMLTIYLLSLVLALGAAAVIGRLLGGSSRAPLLIELPPYRWPSARTVGLVLWQKSRLFLHTAGTVIVAASVVLWVLLTLPRPPVDARAPRPSAASTSAPQAGAAEPTQAAAGARGDRLQQSYAGRLGRLIEPLLAPLGFDWKIGIGLIGSLAAREVFVATMGLVYGVGHPDAESDSLRAALRRERRPNGHPVFTPLTGLSLIVFFMFAMQCLSTLAVVRQESRSWRLALLMMGYLTGLAYVASLLVYQGGRWLGFQ
ncbi:MAG: ferrous iron transport protein B [Proteobacteria bacterium]|nr:ferrous iron transport protein B [Pseudomonadota bacterium]